MRFMIGLWAALAVAAADRPAPKLLLPPKNGVKVPGVQIPFSNLSPELKFEAHFQPDWIAFADSIWLPDAVAHALDRINPKSSEPKFLEPVAGVNKPCGGTVSAFGSLWIPDCESRAVVRVDAKTFKPTGTYSFGALQAFPSIAATADSVWMFTDSKMTLSRIDPVENAVVAEVRLPVGCNGLVVGEGSLWTGCSENNKVLRVNPATAVVERAIEGCEQPRAVAFGERSIWAWCRKSGKLARIDPKTNKVSATIDVGVPGEDGQISIGEGSVWLTLPGFPITRVDPQSDRVVQQFYGPGGGAILSGGGFVWLSNIREGTVLKFDPKRIAATLAE